MNPDEELSFIVDSIKQLKCKLDSLDVMEASNSFYEAIFKIKEMLGMSQDMHELCMTLENYPDILRRWRSIANELMHLQNRRVALWEVSRFATKSTIK